MCVWNHTAAPVGGSLQKRRCSERASADSLHHMRTQGPKAAHWNVGARQHAAERVPLSKPQKLRNERTPSRDGGGDIARRTEHHGGVVELSRGSVRTPRCQPSRARRWGRAAAIERDCDHNCIPTPRTAVVAPVHYREAGDVLTRRASTATTLSRRRRTEAAVELAPLHRRPRGVVAPA